MERFKFSTPTHIVRQRSYILFLFFFLIDRYFESRNYDCTAFFLSRFFVVVFYFLSVVGVLMCLLSDGTRDRDNRAPLYYQIDEEPTAYRLIYIRRNKKWEEKYFLFDRNTEEPTRDRRVTRRFHRGPFSKRVSVILQFLSFSPFLYISGFSDSNFFFLLIFPIFSFYLLILIDERWVRGGDHRSQRESPRCWENNKGKEEEEESKKNI